MVSDPLPFPFRFRPRAPTEGSVEVRQLRLSLPRPLLRDMFPALLCQAHVSLTSQALTSGSRQAHVRLTTWIPDRTRRTRLRPDHMCSSSVQGPAASVRRTAPEAALAFVPGRHGQPGRLPPGTRRPQLAVSLLFQTPLGKQSRAPPAIRNFDHRVSQRARFSKVPLGKKKSGLVSHHLAGSRLQPLVLVPLLIEIDRPLV